MCARAYWYGVEGMRDRPGLGVEVRQKFVDQYLIT
jgi:hypothetical protein